MNYAAFFSYILLTAFTPGPNNIMSMSNVSKYGIKKGIRFNFGILFGLLIVLTLCAAFTSMLYDFIPQIEPVMLCIGAAYILWLAWSVWRDRPHDDKKSVMKTNSVVSGMVLQFVNVKLLLYGVTGMSTFILPYYKGFFSLLPFVLIMALTGFLGTCCWALFGAVFQIVFKKYRKIVNALMALLLVYCAVSQLVGLF